MSDALPDPLPVDPTSADQRILDATLAVLARDGVAGVSMRAVAREAEVAVGLSSYYFETKTAMISAALTRIGVQDATLVAPTNGGDPVEHLRRALQRVLDPDFLDPNYLSLRLQLWSLAGVNEEYAKINQAAQRRYLSGLADMIEAARPDLERPEIERRAADILIVQNGVWLTAILITDPAAVDRAIERCSQLAFG